MRDVYNLITFEILTGGNRIHTLININFLTAGSSTWQIFKLIKLWSCSFQWVRICVPNCILKVVKWFVVLNLFIENKLLLITFQCNMFTFFHHGFPYSPVLCDGISPIENFRYQVVYGKKVGKLVYVKTINKFQCMY